MRERIPRVNAQTRGGLVGGEVWNETGRNGTNECCSDAMSIFTTKIDEDGRDAALATKHATFIEPSSSIVEPSRSFAAP